MSHDRHHHARLSTGIFYADVRKGGQTRIALPPWRSDCTFAIFIEASYAIATGARGQFGLRKFKRVDDLDAAAQKVAHIAGGHNQLMFDGGGGDQHVGGDGVLAAPAASSQAASL